MIKINQPISNVDTFDANMKNLGYNLVAKSFLVKNFNGIDINITRRNNQVETITGYQNNEIVSIPSEIVGQVKADIGNSL